MKMGLLIGVLVCFVYGVILCLKDFKKPAYRICTSSITLSVGRMFQLFVGFFTVPILIQILLKAFVPNFLKSINGCFYLALIEEICLLWLVLWFSRSNGITYIVSLQGILRPVFEGYCKALPMVCVLAFIWETCLLWLIQWGVPISLNPQPIIRLLQQRDSHGYGVYAAGVSIVFLGPIVEELFFRGILLRFFNSFLSVRKSLWASSLIFACAHLHFETSVPLLFLGYWLGLNYCKTGNMGVNVGIHSLFNAVNFAIILCFNLDGI